MKLTGVGVQNRVKDNFGPVVQKEVKIRMGIGTRKDGSNFTHSE